MRVVGVAVMTALIGVMAAATPARAQSEGPHMNLLSDAPSKTPDEIEADQQKEKAYKDSLKKIPDAKGSSDPWGNVRSDAPKAAAAKTTTTKTTTAKTATTKTTTTKTVATARAKTKTGSNNPN